MQHLRHLVRISSISFFVFAFHFRQGGMSSKKRPASKLPPLIIQTELSPMGANMSETSSSGRKAKKARSSSGSQTTPSPTPSRLPAPTFSTTSRKSNSPSPLLLRLQQTYPPPSPGQHSQIYAESDTESTTSPVQFATPSRRPTAPVANTSTNIHNPCVSPSTLHKYIHPFAALWPNSPSTIHPYISKTHVSPPCTVGALTHRLQCGHLVSTSKSELCAKNCVAPSVHTSTPNSSTAGFVTNTRNLDQPFVCPICSSDLLYGSLLERAEGVEISLASFQRSLCVSSNSKWSTTKKALLRAFQGGAKYELLAMIRDLGRGCRGVEDNAIIGDHVQHIEVPSKRHRTGFKLDLRFSEDRLRRQIGEKPTLKVFRESQLKRLLWRDSV